MNTLLRLSYRKRQSVAQGRHGVHRGLYNFFMPLTVMEHPSRGSCVLQIRRATAARHTTRMNCDRNNSMAFHWCGVCLRDSLEECVFDVLVKRGSELNAGHNILVSDLVKDAFHMICRK